MIIGEKCRLYLFSLTVPVIVPVAQFTHKNQITVSTQEQKSSQCTKKESPVYPPGKRGGCSGYMKMIQTPILNIFEYSKKNVFVMPFFIGSQEEKWQLQILAKGRVTCPKCKSVGRKTVDGLKKHLETCKLVSACIVTVFIRISLFS